MFHLAECHARLGQLDEAVQRCTELINYLPCNEEAYRQLMLYYCVSGNHGKAMQTFQKCEKALAEIGTRPSFLTEEIKAKITDAETPSKQQVNLPFLTTILPYLAGPKAVLHQKELRRALEYILYLVEKDVAASRAEEGVSLAELGLNIIIKLEETEGMASCQKQRFMLLSHQASAYDDLGKREEQKACIEQLINIAQETQTPELLAEAYIKQAKYFLAIGSFREAMESAQKCLELSRQLKDQNKEALALNHIGVAYHRLGNCLEAIRHHEEALKIREQINDKKGVASSLNNLGIIFQDSGQYDKALEYYQKSISVCSELNDHFGMGNAHLNSSVACNRLGDYVKALEHLRQAKSHYEEINDEEGVAFVLSNQGSVYVNVGHYSEALVCFEQALAIRERLQARREQALTLNNMSMAYLDLGNTEEALRRFKTAHTIASEIGDQILEAITLANIALCHAGRRNHKKSLGSFNRGLKIVKEIGNKRLEAMMLADKAAVQAEIGQYNHAKKNIQRALRMLESIESLPAGQKASVFFNHFKVLSEMQEEHDAIQSLRKAYEALIEQAEVIRNTAFRESFLTRIPKNREIVKAWEDFRHEA
jgi:tetratricopeptide (TPR) repeat protein